MTEPPNLNVPLIGLSYAYQPGEVRTFLEAGLGSGLSLNETLRQLRSQGVSIANSSARQLANDFYASQNAADVIAHTPFAFRPSIAAYPERTDKGKHGYITYASYTHTNPETGEQTTYGAVVRSAQLLTRSQLNSRIIQTLSVAMETYDFTVATGSITYDQSYRRGI